MHAHTRTLWKLLERYGVPTALFVNKMDLAGADREKLMEQVHDRLSGGCVDFSAAVDCRIRVRYNKNQEGCE